MREFGVPLPKTILHGLRAFPSPLLGEEECIECYNLAPGEHSLRGHTALMPVGFTVPFIEYFAVRDQGGIVWYWLSGPGLDTIYSTSIPVAIFHGYSVTNITPVIVPYWIQVDAVNDPTTQLYIFPAEISGDLLVATVPPAIGTGYDAIAGLVLRSLGGWRHRLAAESLGLMAFWNRMGD